MHATTVVGLQYGDEGKAKIVDVLARSFEKNWDGVNIIRYNGAGNAGHTILADTDKFICHQLPSGVLIKNSKLFISRGCAIDLEQTDKELMEAYEIRKKRFKTSKVELFIDSQTPILFPFHIEEDKEFFQKKIGTTARGNGPAFSDFFARTSILAGDFENVAAVKEKLEFVLELKAKLLGNRNLKFDKELFINKIYEFIGSHNITVTSFKRNLEIFNEFPIIFEGAQGYQLDIYGENYPFVSSSTSSPLQAQISTGIRSNTNIGVFKPYITYVGEDEFFEYSPRESEQIRNTAGEFGATTGRPRRCGYLNMVELQHAVNDYNIHTLAITKIDIVDDLMKQGFEFRMITENGVEVLPKNYIRFIEDYLDVPIRYSSYGPKREQTLII